MFILMKIFKNFINLKTFIFSSWLMDPWIWTKLIESLDMNEILKKLSSETF
jgi:hypothetical protein